ncbi:hypothetical protein DPMN_087488 [Dreissena polymorpha]|uniref:Uncharacterized protein n=1 Tax=Dreissena polymorpha TaxID=45954 RepID=A0A9D4KSC6_DREPO|nr:hypothetical protein DPMN_087488 [Dreissena polymorpha]
MGNGHGIMKSRNTKPRVVLESPLNSTTDTTNQTRVTFADRRKPGSVSVSARPQMTDIGNVRSELFRNYGRVKLQKSAAARAGSNPDSQTGSTVNAIDSTTSIKTNGSVPANGVWEPIIDPYAQKEYSEEEVRLREKYSVDRNSSNNHYRGFVVNDNVFISRGRVNGLVRLNEI